MNKEAIYPPSEP